MSETASSPQDHASRGGRRRSREFALQALYQWLVNADDAADLCMQAKDKPEFRRADGAYFEILVRGVLAHAEQLHTALQPFLDRPAKQLSPVEHALLLVGAFELTVAVDVPYRVAINEAVELAKLYGGTDGHKYVNGVLDKLASQARPGETKKR